MYSSSLQEKWKGIPTYIKQRTKNGVLISRYDALDTQKKIDS